MVNKKGFIADTIHGNILLTDFERKIMSHVTFNRLHDVYQNSTVYMTFPCNRTKRFEHSLGTMKLCSDMFSSAVANTKSEVAKEFLDYYNKKLIGIIIEIKNKKYKEYGPHLGGRVKKINVDRLPEIKEKYASFIPPSREIIELYTTYFVLLQAIRISALLHDIGHPPYSHITEFALENVRNKYKNCSQNVRIKEFNEIMDNFFREDGKKLHEQMGDKIVEIILDDSIDSISENEANKNTDIFNRQVVHILIKEVVQKILSNEKPFDSLHRIIDGTLDGDRLDYVTRDALNSGLDKGAIEYERIFNSMVITEYKDEYWICPGIKSLNTVEDFLVIDNAISAELINRENELTEKIKELRDLSRDYKGEGKGTVTIDPFLNGVEKILSLSKSIDENQTFQGLIFSHLRKLYDNIYDEQIGIETFLADIIQKSKIKFPKDSVEDVFVIVKKYDIGIKKPLLLYNDNQKKVVSIHEVSPVARILDLSFDMFPQFFIYVLKTEKYKDEIIETEQFLREAGKEIAVGFCNRWMNILNKNISEFKQI